MHSYYIVPTLSKALIDSQIIMLVVTGFVEKYNVESWERGIKTIGSP